MIHYVNDSTTVGKLHVGRCVAKLVEEDIRTHGISVRYVRFFTFSKELKITVFKIPSSSTIVKDQQIQYKSASDIRWFGSLNLV